MADIRIKDLPLATGPTAPTGTDFLAIDGLTTRKTPISALGDVAVPIASQAEAEAGVNATKRMVPVTVKQSIASEVGVSLASKAQGDLADSALQPGEAATPAQGSKADTALQPSDVGSSGLLAPSYYSRSVAAARDLTAYSEVEIRRWSNTSRLSHAQYVKVGSEPAHDLKFQDAAGNWFEYDGSSISVLVAGAMADNSTDDLAAFNRAKVYLEAKLGGVLYTPARPLPYYLSSTLYFGASKPLIFRGDGGQVSLLNFAPIVVDCIVFGGAVYSSNTQRIEDIGFSASSNVNRVHIKAQLCVFQAEGVYGRDALHDIVIDQAFAPTIEHCRFNGTRSNSIYGVTASSMHGARILMNGFFGCGVALNASAISAKTSDDIAISYNRFEQSHSAFILFGCTAVTAENNYIEYGTYPFYLDSADSGGAGRRCAGITVRSNWIALFDQATYIEQVDGFYFYANTIFQQTIGFGPAANSSEVSIGQNTLLTGGVIASPPWTQLTLINGWTQGAVPLQVNATQEGMVSIRGSITRSSGSGSQNVGTVPARFAPTVPKVFIVPTSTGVCLCSVNSSGVVYVEAGGAFTGTVNIDVNFKRL